MTTAAAAAAAAASSAIRRCALVIGLDGFRPDCISPELTPTLWGLMHPARPSFGPVASVASDGGQTVSVAPALSCAFSLRSQVGDICWSGPGWTSACTGVWRDKHGVSGNLFVTQQFASYPTLFQRLRTAKPDAVTCSSVNWKPLADHVLLPCTRSAVHEDDDPSVLSSAQAMLTEQPRLDLLFVHLDLVDARGHEFDYGPSIPEYVAAVKETDARVAVLLRCLREERRWYPLEDWLVVLTTDHGGIDFNHEDGRPENRTNFLILQGSDVAPGEIFPAPLIVDVAPTVLAHLGVKLQSAWHLDGRPVGLKLTGATGAAESFMDLHASQDPTDKFPILPEELEAGPSPDAQVDDLAAEAAKIRLAQQQQQGQEEEVPAAAAAAAARSRRPSIVQLVEAAAVAGPVELEKEVVVDLSKQQERK